MLDPTTGQVKTIEPGSDELEHKEKKQNHHET
jgi:hypothetical protein